MTKIITIFNNKGGVGKTTLTFHLAHALAEMGHKVLAVDLDPQCNLSIYCMPESQIQQIWETENAFIDEPGFEATKKELEGSEFVAICSTTRTAHFLLKPAEEGTGDVGMLPPPYKVSKNFDLIPGRLTLHMFEEMVARRWSEAFIGHPLALRTISEIRRLILQYAKKYGYEYVIVDTSPSLGQLNKVVLSTVDAFFIPCAPDMFSLYGVRNIGSSLKRWRKEIETLYSLVPDSRRPYLPGRFVRFLGYTIYNARLRTGTTKWNMAIAHYNYAVQIPKMISGFIEKDISNGLSNKELNTPIGEMAVMHSHNTFPGHAQKYHCPMWKLPECGNLDSGDQATIQINKEKYFDTWRAYAHFAEDIISRADKVVK